jgi:hypothetical protein
MIKRGIIAALLIGTLVATGSAAPAFASLRVPDGSFRIQNVKSGLYLQSPSSNPRLSDVVQEARSTVGWQEFRFVPRGAYDNLQQVLLLRNIGISWGSTTPGVQAFLGSPNGRVNQDWMINPKAGGVYELVNRGSGLCLGMNNASTQPGTHAVQFPCDGFVNQQWRFIPW